MATHRIAVIPGDGIGREVIPAGLRVLQRVAELGSFALQIDELPWSCRYYLENGAMMPADGLAILADHDAIYLGAVGDPAVPDDVAIWGLVIAIRQGFDLYVNLRPIRVLPGITTPLRSPAAERVDILVVRENSEGEYAGMGGRYGRGTPGELALETSLFTRRGIARVARYAFERARTRSKRVASATKSNALRHTAVLWDEVVAEVARDYPDVIVTKYHVDALSARFISQPESLDVIVASNLFGDILTDLGAAIQGSLGLAASANLDPERRRPSMFEPIHGSAPDIAGMGIANPIGAIWAGALMLEHLGESEASGLVMGALEAVARDGPRTPDLGGQATTEDLTEAVLAALPS